MMSNFLQTILTKTNKVFGFKIKKKIKGNRSKKKSKAKNLNLIQEAIGVIERIPNRRSQV